MISHILMTCEYSWPLIYFENDFANEKKCRIDRSFIFRDGYKLNTIAQTLNFLY